MVKPQRCRGSTGLQESGRERVQKISERIANTALRRGQSNDKSRNQRKKDGEKEGSEILTLLGLPYKEHHRKVDLSK